MSNVNGTGSSDFFKAEGSAMLSGVKDLAGGVVGAAKKLHCVWTASQAEGCPHPKPKEQSDARSAIENSPLGRALQDKFFGNDYHRKAIETGDIPDK